MNNKKCIAKKIEKQWKNTIISRLDYIKDIDVLESIDQFVEECEPITLKDYINVHFDKYHSEIKKELEHEVRKIYLEIGNKFESDPYIDHFCELYVQGYSLDIWIHENGSLFNPCELALIIFKLWSKEIVFQ